MGELGSIYEETRARITDLVVGVDDPSAVAVPACPGWSVHDLVAHLTGNCADTISGNVDGVATDAWTQAQVDKRRDRSTKDVLDEWAELAPTFAAMLDDWPGYFGRMPVGDIAEHEHDLRGALGRPGERDSRAVAVGVEFLVEVLVKPGATTFGLGPLEVATEDRRWIAGTGAEPTGDLDAWQTALSGNGAEETTNEPVAKVSTRTFELFRAIGGRRTERQIRSFFWSVDPGPYLPLFGFGPFSIRAEHLDE